MRPIEGVLIIIITVILLLFVQLNLQQFVVFGMMYERWADECLMAMIRGRNQRRRRITRSPYAWSVPRPVEKC